MRVLVTGGNGQLGLAFAALMPGAVVVDRATLDVTDPDSVGKVFAEVRPEVVYNTAAYTAVDRAESEPEVAHAVNAGAVAILAGHAAASGALLVTYSTDYVFAGDSPRPYSEDDPTGPLSVYGRTKLEGEQAVAASGCRYLLIRTSWVFGEGHNFVRSILGAGARHPELSVVDDQRGRPTYAPDLAQGSLALVEAGCTGLYHLSGGGDAGTWADVAQTALGAGGVPTRVRRVTTAQYYAGKQGPIAPRPANSELDCSKAGRSGVALRAWPEAVGEYVKELVS